MEGVTAPPTGAGPSVEAGPSVATEVEGVAAVEPASASEEAKPPVAPASPEPTPQPEPVATAPVIRGTPTPASMTERGVWLFNQGRTQESIDQFTKAIALDADYQEAWEHRAEAYSRLGRGEQAAEDRRRLQAIIASSSTS